MPILATIMIHILRLALNLIIAFAMFTVWSKCRKIYWNRKYKKSL